MVLERTDRDANDWDYFLGDIALPHFHVPLYLSLSVRTPLSLCPSFSLFFYFSFHSTFISVSVSMPRAPSRRISMSHREYCSFARCFFPFAPSSEIRGSRVTLHRPDLDKKRMLQGASGQAAGDAALKTSLRYLRLPKLYTERRVRWGFFFFI